jgi:DNA modification methylase
LNTPSFWQEDSKPPVSPDNEVRTSGRNSSLTEIEKLDLQLLDHFKEKLTVDDALTRSLVSFQANKNKAGYRWYKFKEAFSAPLIDYLLYQFGISKGILLDPFAGSGTALFVASTFGLDAHGIEVLPIGQELVKARKLFESQLEAEDLIKLNHWAKTKEWERSADRISLLELRITKGAYPVHTQESIESYLGAIQMENERVRAVLLFALLSVIESISYTRKDGQYLRWDYRSGRAQGSKIFNKGKIYDFNEAISAKIEEIVFDLQNNAHSRELFPSINHRGEIRLYPGSCLGVLPTLPDKFYDAVITSPPYCNRYDYTRTYALELALLGIGEMDLLKLRQLMLSCTVENREKDLLQINPQWSKAIAVADNQMLLQRIIAYLEDQRVQGILNNNGIPRMVRGYFYEMACVIAECARVMKPSTPLLMINDNVRYAGASMSVDLILSDMAEKLGFVVEKILVLPGGKGNSSQQMGEHGREPLRKCVYAWRRI